MSLHNDLPIHRTGVRLLALAIKAQEQMPRGVKRSLGDKISTHCVEMLDLMALANATQNGELNPSKTILQPVARGVDFVGHVIKPWHRTTRRGTVAKAVARMRDLPENDVHQVANSYFGLLSQASHSHQDRARFANAVRHRGHCITGSLKKALP